MERVKDVKKFSTDAKFLETRRRLIRNRQYDLGKVGFL